MFCSAKERGLGSLKGACAVFFVRTFEECFWLGAKERPKGGQWGVVVVGGEQNRLVFLSVRGSQTQKWLLVRLQQKLESNGLVTLF